MARLPVSRESEHIYRGFPFHPFHPPLPDGKGFGDRYGNELDLRHLQAESMRRSAGEPSERLGVRKSPYLDSRAFGHEAFHSSMPRMDRGNGESEWRRRDRAALVNGDFHHGKGQFVVFLVHQTSSTLLHFSLKLHLCLKYLLKDTFIVITSCC